MRYDSYNSLLYGFELYDSKFKYVIGERGDSSFKVDLSESERVAGIQAHKREDRYWNLQLIIGSG